MCGFTGGGLVKYSRHNYCAEFSLTAHSGGRVVKVGYNTSLLLTAGADSQLKVWRLEDGRALCELSHPGGTVQDMKVGREKIVTASQQESLRPPGEDCGSERKCEAEDSAPTERSHPVRHLPGLPD